MESRWRYPLAVLIGLLGLFWLSFGLLDVLGMYDVRRPASNIGIGLAFVWAAVTLWRGRLI